jgi:hypothetical protein
MLWELLTGRRLFDGPPREALAQVMFGPIPRPSSIRPGISPDLEAVAMRLLERDLSARYANAGLAIDDLASCADAPRGGGRELARLLAARFPEALAARSARPHVEDGISPASPSPGPGPQDQVTVTDERHARGRGRRPGALEARWQSSAPPGNADNRPAGRSTPGARWPRIAAAGLVVAAAAAGTIALAVATRDGGPSGGPAGGSSLAPDGLGSAIKPASPPVDPPRSAVPPPARTPPADAGIATAAPDAAPAAVSLPKPPAPPPGRQPKPARSDGSRPSSSEEPDDILESLN